MLQRSVKIDRAADGQPDLAGMRRFTLDNGLNVAIYPMVMHLWFV